MLVCDLAKVDDSWYYAMKNGDFPTAEKIIRSEKLKFYYEDYWNKKYSVLDDLSESKLTLCEKQALIRLLVEHGYKVRTAYTVLALSEYPALLKFVLAEFNFSSKMIEKGLCDQGMYGRHVSLAAITVCINAGWTPSRKAVAALFFSAASAWDVKTAAFLLKYYGASVDEIIGLNPYRASVWVISAFPLAARLRCQVIWDIS